MNSAAKSLEIEAKISSVIERVIKKGRNNGTTEIGQSA